MGFVFGQNYVLNNYPNPLDCQNYIYNCLTFLWILSSCLNHLQSEFCFLSFVMVNQNIEHYKMYNFRALEPSPDPGETNEVGEKKIMSEIHCKSLVLIFTCILSVILRDSINSPSSQVCVWTGTKYHLFRLSTLPTVCLETSQLLWYMSQSHVINFSLLIWDGRGNKERCDRFIFLENDNKYYLQFITYADKGKVGANSPGNSKMARVHQELKVEVFFCHSL